MSSLAGSKQSGGDRPEDRVLFDHDRGLSAPDLPSLYTDASFAPDSVKSHSG